MTMMSTADSESAQLVHGARKNFKHTIWIIPTGRTLRGPVGYIGSAVTPLADMCFGPIWVAAATPAAGAGAAAVHHPDALKEITWAVVYGVIMLFQEYVNKCVQG